MDLRRGLQRTLFPLPSPPSLSRPAGKLLVWVNAVGQQVMLRARRASLPLVVGSLFNTTEYKDVSYGRVIAAYIPI